MSYTHTLTLQDPSPLSINLKDQGLGTMLSLRMSIGSTTLLSRGYSPYNLFAASEPGVWYDPSDVANLAWRRNLLTFSEQFDNAAWSKSNVTVTADIAVAPNGASTADKLIETAVTNNHLFFFANSSITTLPNTAYTATFYAKEAERRYAVFGIRSSGAGAGGGVAGNSRSHITVDLRTGIASQLVNIASHSVTAEGNGWYKIVVTTNGFDRNDLQPCIALSDVAAPTVGGFMVYSYAGDGTSGILAWGAQFELGSIATEYQPIGDLNAEVISRFPNATLYQDTAGTTPVTTPGQTVALALDKSRGLVLGSELVTNGDFSAGSAGWINDATWTFSGGTANISSGAAANPGLSRSGVFPASRWVRYSFTVSNYVSGAIALRCYGSGGNDIIVSVTANGTYSGLYFTRADATGLFGFSHGSGVTLSLDNISVRELPGNHATQATLASRPTYGIVPRTGRRNLLTFTEQFDNAAWAKLRLNITPNAIPSPDGATTADHLIDTAVSGTHVAIQLITKAASAITYAASVYLKSAARTKAEFRMSDQAGNGVRVPVDLSDGSVGVVAVFGTGFTSASSAIQAIGNGWYRVTLTATSNSATSLGHEVYVCDASGNTSYVGDGTSGIYAWGAQLETGSTATAYQRVGSQFDVTEAGVPSLSYLSFDGIDDFLVTPTISPDIATSDGAARRNLLTYPTAFDNAAWPKANVTVAANVAVAPDGTTTADRFTADATTSIHRVISTAVTLASGVNCVHSVYLKAGTHNFVQIHDGASASYFANFNVSTGVVGTATGCTATITDVGNGWYRCSIAMTLNGANPVLCVGMVTSNTAARNESWTAAGTETVLVWGAQLEVGSTATAFQNIGFDKVQVFAGVRKLSDAALGMVAEMSTSVFLNAGSFGLSAPISAAANYGLTTRGSASQVTVVTGNSFSAPITNVITGTSDISGDSAILRVNGTQAAQSTTDQGTGNYLAYPLYIGRRGGTSLPFNGQLYSLIVRFGPNLDANAITNSETWVNGRTGAF